MPDEENMESKKEQTFTKKALVASRKYRDHQDLLSVILNDGEKYTFSEADRAIRAYNRKEIS